jgi:uncharacterized membrane protein SpoIIM required for sporulation
MKESEFIDQNKDKWLDYEKIIKQPENDPDELSDVFIQVTDDLSHSRSHYPNRSVRVYINDLAGKIFDKLGKRKKLDFEVIKNFYTIEVPQLMYLARKEMIISFVIFILSMGIGIYSSIQNPEFASVVLGESYVQMTKANIQSGDAMAVYTGGSGIEGFIMILENNARIDIMMLGLGLFFSFGAIWVLVRNGIMVGVFQYFFVQHGGFKDSLLTIWLHGTIEISTIGLMGGVALLAGRGLLFPGNYTRYQSWRLSAGNAGKLLLMVLPFTFIAAVIEGFVTRMTGMPDVIKGLFILLSLALVVLYFFVYPAMVHKRHGVNPLHEKLRKDHPPKPISKTEIKAPAQIITDAFVTYKSHFGRNVALCVIAGIIYPLLLYFNFERYFQFHTTPAMEWLSSILNLIFGAGALGSGYLPETGDYRLFKFAYFGIWSIILLLVNASTVFKLKLNLRSIPTYLIAALVISGASYLGYYAKASFPLNYLASIGYFILVGLSVTVLLITHHYKVEKGVILNTFFTKIFQFFVPWLAVSVLLFFAQMMVHSGLSSFTVYVLNDLLPFDASIKEKISIGVQVWIYATVVMATIPFYLYATYYTVMSIVEKHNALHLKQEVNVIVAGNQ